MALVSKGDNLIVRAAYSRVDGYVEVHLDSDDGTVITLLADTDVHGYFDISEEDE